MRGKALAAALAAAAVTAVAAPAAATITSPAPGAAVASATLRVTVVDMLGTRSCTFALNGTVASAASVVFTSGSGTCTSGAAAPVLSGFPWTLGLTLTPRNWSLTGIAFDMPMPASTWCSYAGAVGGTFAAAVGTTTFTGTASTLHWVPAAPYCARNFNSSGTLTMSVSTV